MLPSARARTQDERSAATRRALIEAAIETICDLGFANATVDAICACAGVTRGAVQHHFGGRGELLLAVSHHFGEQHAALTSSPFRAGMTLAEGVADCCDRYWTIYSSRAYFSTVQILACSAADPVVRPGALLDLEAFEHRLDRRDQAFFAHWAVPPATVATARHVILAVLRGLVIRTIYKRERAGWAAERALVKQMVTAVFEAAAARPDRSVRR